MKANELTPEQQADLHLAEARRMPGMERAKGETIMIAAGLLTMRDAMQGLKDSGQAAFDKINARLDAVEARLDALEGKKKGKSK